MMAKLGMLFSINVALLISPLLEREANVEQVDFIEVNQVSNIVQEDSVYAGIINYSHDPTLDIKNRMTCAHETTHMINAGLRNSLKKGKNINVFYLPTGWACVIEEPNMRKSQVAQFIPSNVRGYRYSTYVTGATEWDNQPLYLVDEWSAYINGAMVGIDDVNNNRYTDGWTDGVSGCLELSLYCVALSMAIEEYDKDYWNSNDHFKSFMKWNLQRAYNTYMIGKDYPQFKWDKQEEFFRRFRESPSTKKMRDFITEHFDGIGLQ